MVVDCAICLHDINNNSRNGIYTVAKCDHKFHTDCFLEWCTKGSFTCPLCRQDPRSKFKYMSKEKKISFLRRYSLRKNSPILLKETANKVRECEKSMKEHKRELKKMFKDNKDVFNKVNNLRSKYRFHFLKYEESVEQLANYPLLRLD